MKDALIQLLTSDAVISGIGTLLALWLTWLAAKRGIDIAKVRAGADLAYEAVNLLKSKTPTKIDDKAAVGLKALAEHLGRDLSPSEIALAMGVFESRHDAEKERVAAAAELLDRALKAEAKK